MFPYLQIVEIERTICCPIRNVYIKNEKVNKVNTKLKRKKNVIEKTKIT